MDAPLEMSQSGVASNSGDKTREKRDGNKVDRETAWHLSGERWSFPLCDVRFVDGVSGMVRAIRVR